jgi:hypothetical protein
MEHQNLLRSLHKGEWGRRENNGGDEPIWGIIFIYIYMEMSQQNPLHNYHKLTKMFFFNK